MFVVADVLARHLASQGKRVIFTVASHYSGNTAQAAAEALTRFFIKKPKEGDAQIFKLHRDIYHTPVRIIKTFTNAHHLLNYYTQAIYWELNSINLSVNFKYSYETNHPDFQMFVNALINAYEKKELLIKNNQGDLALNYNNPTWRQQVEEAIKKTEFNQSFHQKNILAAVKNIRNDWGFLRTTGFGAKYKQQWIIDPMFDSELFILFDLYIRFKKTAKNNINDRQEFFNQLFLALEKDQKSDNDLINKILENLPCDIFVGEEHLKNWLVKRFYAETKLLHPKYQTKKYVVMGMGFVDGKKMSASKGSGVLIKDLIKNYGPIIARLTILLSGGNIAKICNYDQKLPQTATNFIEQFIPYFTQLLAVNQNNPQQTSASHKKQLNSLAQKIDQLIETGNYRQALIEILIIAPAKYQQIKDFTPTLVNFYKKYLLILLPGFYQRFPTL